jgi:hypothetical protein
LNKSESFEKIEDVMRLNHDITKNNIPGNARSSRSERCFDLSLSAGVSGTNAHGMDFDEVTELSSISSLEAVFWLQNKVVIGSKLVLSLHVPKTLIRENQLNLIVSGEVIFASTDPSAQNKQLVSIQLDKMYKIQPIYSSI